MKEATPKEILELSNRIRPLLAGAGQQVQGGVLADLMSIWLAGHFVSGNREETLTLRIDLLKLWLDTLLELIRDSEQELGIDHLVDGDGTRH
jgi:hypothetical protein